MCRCIPSSADPTRNASAGSDLTIEAVIDSKGEREGSSRSTTADKANIDNITQKHQSEIFVPCAVRTLHVWREA